MMLLPGRDAVCAPDDPACSRRIMIVAGEASGDIYGAELAHEIKKLDPGAHLFGICGERMREAGVETLVDASTMAVMGLVEVFRHFGVIASAFLKLRGILKTSPPDILILIDYPGFNIRLAHAAKKAGVTVLYYISPKVWAWKAGRIKSIAASVDHMAVIFPFEVPLYEREGVPVTFVGHPLLDMVPEEGTGGSSAAGFDWDPTCTVIGLFPGSRRSEISRLLPVMLEAARLLQGRYPDARFVLPLASTLGDDDIMPLIAAAGVAVHITRDRIHQVIGSCDAIIAASGTVTLEIALSAIPMVIIYRMNPLTYRIAKRVVRIAHIGLCNIVANETVVRELIQDDANPAAIAAEIDAILSNEQYRTTMIHKLAATRGLLGGGGASARLAGLALDMISGKRN